MNGLFLAKLIVVWIQLPLEFHLLRQYNNVKAP
jgi:hypothetical protein